MTGGSNVLNAAMFQVSYLGGVIGKLYYTFVSNIQQDGKYLQPFVQSDLRRLNYCEIVVLKTKFDEKMRHLLGELASLKQGGREWIEGEELWSRLGGSNFAEKNSFVRDYLNTLDGRAIQREGSREQGRTSRVRMIGAGEALLSIMNSELFGSLAGSVRLSAERVAELTSDLEIRRLWPGGS
jgi:hypothetical protein